MGALATCVRYYTCSSTGGLDCDILGVAVSQRRTARCTTSRTGLRFRTGCAAVAMPGSSNTFRITAGTLTTGIGFHPGICAGSRGGNFAGVAVTQG